MHQRAAASSARRKPFRHHRHRGVEGGAVEIPVRLGATDQREQVVFRVLGARRLGDDLLRQHVERRILRDDRVEPSTADGAQQRQRFDQVVARHREHAALRRARDGVAGAADALQQGRDPVRRADLADKIDVADVDAQFERRRRDQRLELPALEPRLGVEPPFLREASMMRRDGFFAEALAEMSSHALGQSPRVDEHERRPVLAHEAGEAVVVPPPRPRAT